MTSNDEPSLQIQIEELTDAIHALAEKQNSQFTDLMLKLDELKADKERLDLVVADAAQHMENLYERARQLIIKTQKVSTSYLQRKLAIGYEKAVLLVGRLENDMIIRKGDGTQPWEVLTQDTEEEDLSASDELYEEVRRLAIEMGHISISDIQHNFGTGYARAARLIDLLEEGGIVEEAKLGQSHKTLPSNNR
jgi:DNA segregation ATPase FtsK/SpoIIIE-like protein